MGMTRAAKQTEIESIKERLKDAEILVITQNKGMTVAQVTQLRNELRAAGATFKVAKNTLVKLAIKGTKFEGISNILTGPTAIASSKDPAVAKVAQNFAKGNEKFVILGGAMGEMIMDAKAVETLSKLPSLNELRSKLCGLLVAPATKIAGVLQAPARNLVGVTQAYGAKT